MNANTSRQSTASASASGPPPPASAPSTGAISEDQAVEGGASIATPTVSGVGGVNAQLLGADRICRKIENLAAEDATSMHPRLPPPFQTTIMELLKK
jgi:hypothetical protein